MCVCLGSHQGHCYKTSLNVYIIFSILFQKKIYLKRSCGVLIYLERRWSSACLSWQSIESKQVNREWNGTQTASNPVHLLWLLVSQWNSPSVWLRMWTHAKRMLWLVARTTGMWVWQSDLCPVIIRGKQTILDWKDSLHWITNIIQLFIFRIVKSPRAAFTGKAQ